MAILFGRDIPFEVEEVTIDQSGRYIILDIKVGSQQFILANIYGPNKDDPVFYVKLFESIESRENDSMILAGDFNASMDPNRDLYNHKGSSHVKKRAIITQYIEQKDLVDIWRIKNPMAKIFS